MYLKTTNKEANDITMYGFTNGEPLFQELIFIHLKLYTMVYLDRYLQT